MHHLRIFSFDKTLSVWYNTDMNYELTIFKNQFDNKTHRKVSYQSWDKFVDLLYKLSEQKGQKGGKHSSVLITPAIFKADSTRSNTCLLYTSPSPRD